MKKRIYKDFITFLAKHFFLGHTVLYFVFYTRDGVSFELAKATSLIKN